jgi:P-type Ca2+ transporter type 2C
VPWLAAIFNIVPLTWQEWQLVLLFASPVLLIDEVLKFLGRTVFHPAHPPSLKGKQL